ncbi:MAG: hypothetical protein ACRCX2_22240 [Paraclostridium sp.]
MDFNRQHQLGYSGQQFTSQATVNNQQLTQDLLANYSELQKRGNALKQGVNYIDNYSREGFMNKVIMSTTGGIREYFGYGNEDLHAVNALLKNSNAGIEVKQYSDIPFISGRKSVERSMTIATIDHTLNSLNKLYEASIASGDFRTANHALDMQDRINSINIYDRIDNRALQYMLLQVADRAAHGIVHEGLNERSIDQMVKSGIQEKRGFEQIFSILKTGFASPLIDIAKTIINQNRFDTESLTEREMSKMSDQERVRSSFIQQGAIFGLIASSLPASQGGLLLRAIKTGAKAGFDYKLMEAAGEAGAKIASSFGSTTNEKERYGKYGSLVSQIASPLIAHPARRLFQYGVDKFFARNTKDMATKANALVDTDVVPSNSNFDGSGGGVIDGKFEVVDTAFDPTLRANRQNVNLSSIKDGYGRQIGSDVLVGINNEILNEVANSASNIAMNLNMEGMNLQEIPQLILESIAQGNIVSPITYNTMPTFAENLSFISSSGRDGTLTFEAIADVANRQTGESIKRYIGGSELQYFSGTDFETPFSLLEGVKKSLSERNRAMYDETFDLANANVDQYNSRALSRKLNEAQKITRDFSSRVRSHHTGKKEASSIGKDVLATLDAHSNKLDTLIRNLDGEKPTAVENRDQFEIPRVLHQIESTIKQAGRDIYELKHGQQKSTGSSLVSNTLIDIDNIVADVFGKKAYEAYKATSNEYSMYIEGSGINDLLNYLEETNKGNKNKMDTSKMNAINYPSLLALKQYMASSGLLTELKQFDNAIKHLEVSLFNQKYSKGSATDAMKPYSALGMLDDKRFMRATKLLGISFDPIEEIVLFQDKKNKLYKPYDNKSSTSTKLSSMIRKIMDKTGLSIINDALFDSSIEDLRQAVYVEDAFKAKSLFVASVNNLKKVQ